MSTVAAGGKDGAVQTPPRIIPNLPKAAAAAAATATAPTAAPAASASMLSMEEDEMSAEQVQCRCVYGPGGLGHF